MYMRIGDQMRHLLRLARTAHGLLLGFSIFLAICAAPAALAVPDADLALWDDSIRTHPGLSGAYVLDTGAQALLARAWLADHAQRSIDVQYFIWSTDNIGILAMEALLRAADRGVKVRVIVDDLLIDAPDTSLLALADHPNIDIRVYNPKSSVGVPLKTRLLNLVTDFRGVNQRMHNKIFVVDGKVAITGGRNMAAEYFDYNHEYNFRDRDVLLLGEAPKAMQASFKTFWASKLSIKVEDLYDSLGLSKKSASVDSGEIKRIYQGLHDYAKSPDNFAPEVRADIATMAASFARLAQQIVWTDVRFISDLPGKNGNRLQLDGGGLTTAALAEMVDGAQHRIVIQSPYLVLSDPAIELFRKARARGVSIRINTNSLASTDNVPAFSGYRNQRETLLKMGLEIYEYKPDPQTQRRMLQQSVIAKTKMPRFALHAKTMVVDSKKVYIGTFNFDPRSANLNTEAGAIIEDAALAQSVEQAIEIDMGQENSWNAATDSPDQYVPLLKRSKVRLLQMLPIKAVL